jgi:hypothetical protein
MTTDERFDSKWVPEPNSGCYLWTAARDRRGYGYFTVAGRLGRAHRYAYQRAGGCIPDGMCVCHSCDTPECVNPDHLWLGTVAENNSDKQRKGRAMRGQGHERAKLTEKQVIKIRERCASGEMQKQIASEYGVLPTTINNIVVRRSWRHI